MKIKEKAKTNCQYFDKECIITKDFDYKVRTICASLNINEWSGILFYKEDDNNNIIPTDIEVMSYDTTATTSFQYNEEATEKLMEMADKGYKAGLIHSHNTMAVFMSQTDEEELRDNAKSYKNYVSVIVNNHGDYVCYRTHEAQYEVSELRFTIFGRPFIKEVKSEILIEELSINKEQGTLSPRNYDSFKKKLPSINKVGFYPPEPMLFSEEDMPSRDFIEIDTDYDDVYTDNLSFNDDEPELTLDDIPRVVSNINYKDKKYYDLRYALKGKIISTTRIGESLLINPENFKVIFMENDFNKDVYLITSIVDKNNFITITV